MLNQRPQPLPHLAVDATPSVTPTDAELAARVQGGDHGAFELIMRRHNRRLFRLARSYVKNTAEAEDVLQEAYVRAYAHLGDLADGDRLAAWLARIVANEALGRLRAAARVISLEDHLLHRRVEARDGTDGEPASDQPNPERMVASSELRRLLEAAVDALPDDFRTVFVLREVEGLSTAETAACLAIRPETVKTRLHRARLQLQETLGQQLLASSPTLFGFDGGRCDRVVGQVLARLDRPTAPGPVHSAAASEPVLPSPSWLSRVFALLGQWRQR
jgi:RNA polymerase sigma-70 factor, ECF subfamily